MAGRVLTFQLHPGECVTNYAALVSMRCNVDVQDLRRVLPPNLWMEREDLETNMLDEKDERYGQCAYPQRYKEFSVGPRAEWGWMQHLGTIDHYACNVIVCDDWHEIFTELSQALCATHAFRMHNHG